MITTVSYFAPGEHDRAKMALQGVITDAFSPTKKLAQLKTLAARQARPAAAPNLHGQLGLDFVSPNSECTLVRSKVNFSS